MRRDVNPKDMRRVIMAVLFLALTSPLLGAVQVSEHDRDAIREVIFNDLMRGEPGQREGYRVYFLSVGMTFTNNRPVYDGPSEELVRRFSRRSPPVRSASRCAHKGSWVVDKETGERGILFGVSVGSASETEAEATGSVFRAGLNGYSNKYWLSKKGGKWKITKPKVNSIS